MRYLLLALPLLALAGCGDDDGSTPTPTPSGTPTPAPTATPTPTPTGTPTPAATPVTITSDFTAGYDGWLAQVADYAQGQEKGIAFAVAREKLPAPLDANTGVKLTSFNQSDDTVMYLARPVTGLAPNTRYRIDSELRFATNAPTMCGGIGGAPGDSVYIKGGASPIQPAQMLARDLVRVNFDKGNQGTGGTQVALLGTFAQPQSGGPCSGGAYQEKTLRSDTATAPIVTSDTQGRLWLVAASDSGYEGITSIYWLSLRFTLTPQ